MTESRFELRHLRTFTAVAERRSFTRAADDLHIAQQAVSQQINALERSLGVTLLLRTPRNVELTAEGAVFLAESRRVLGAADRAIRRVKAAARGEVGTVRLAYTLTTVWETIPALLAQLNEVHPQLKIDAREVFGGDIPALLLAERYDLAIAPMTGYPSDFQTHTIRREALCIALSDTDPLVRRRNLKLATLSKRPFEVWPREMAPGFYDAVIATCRTGGFEPTLDKHGTGNTVWGNIARGRGVGLINASLAEQLPRGVALVELSDPPASLAFDAVWVERELPAIERVLETAAQLGSERGWLG